MTFSMASLRTPLALCVLYASAGLTDAKAFLSHEPRHYSNTSGKEVDSRLMAEIEEVLGAEHRKGMESRVAGLEELLRPTLTALPATGNGGRFGHAAVRYALHRVFVQRHGWFVRGLHAGGDSWDSSSPAEALQGRTPEHIQQLFEGRLGAGGLTTHEVALLAAIIENMAHDEALAQVRAAYVALGIDTEAPLDATRVDDVLDVYMSSYITGKNLLEMSKEEVLDNHGAVAMAYDGWAESKKFVRDVRGYASSGKRSLDFSDVKQVVYAIGDRYGKWQDRECRAMKNQLMEMQQLNTGRVRLATFYGSAFHGGKWQFTESSAYLRQLGALDESDPSDPRVIIPNYITSPSNCVASSQYYSVCCMDECEELLGHIEEKIAAPYATAEQILALVKVLPSSSSPANRTLPDALVQRLSQVAEGHGGKVPLHGRLFSQWMHNAYPRECTFPHVTGTTKPRTAEAFKEETGIQEHASDEEMLQFIDSKPGAVPVEGECGEDHCGVTWEHHTEELFVAPPTTTTGAPASEYGSHALRTAAVSCAAIASLAGMLMKTVQGTMQSVGVGGKSKCEKYMV